MEPSTYLQFFLALILVLGLIMCMSWALKRFGFGAGMAGVVSRRRLRTIESASLDTRHRVVLLRRDDVEHLVLIGPNTSQVIETGIPAPAQPADGAATAASPFPSFRQFLGRDKQS